MVVPKKPILFLRIYFTALFFWFLTRFFNPHKILAFTQTKLGWFFGFSRDDYPRLLAYSDFVFQHLFFRRLKNYCLIHSMVLFCFLKPTDENLKIVFGMAKINGEIKGHSWLESKNLPLIEKPKALVEYERIGEYV